MPCMEVESVLECLHGEDLVDDLLFTKSEVNVYVGYNWNLRREFKKSSLLPNLSPGCSSSVRAATMKLDQLEWQRQAIYVRALGSESISSAHDPNAIKEG